MQQHLPESHMSCGPYVLTFQMTICVNISNDPVWSEFRVNYSKSGELIGNYNVW